VIAETGAFRSFPAVPLLFHQWRVVFSAAPIDHGQMMRVGWSF